LDIELPLSTRRYTELRLVISDCLQRRDWKQLFEFCGTSDDETSKTIAAIFTLYEPVNVWRFLDYVFRLSSGDRRQRRDSVATACYILGRMGQTNTKKAISHLRLFLSDDHMLRIPVMSALSNLWVLDARTTSSIVIKSWVLKDDDNDDLQEIGVKSTEYLASKQPKMVVAFLLKVAALSSQRKIAARTASELIENYVTSLGSNNRGKPTARIRKK